MQKLQRKLLRYNHGYFMAAGLAIFLTGFGIQIISNPEALRIESFQLLTVIGALILGYGTGRCDETCRAE